MPLNPTLFKGQLSSFKMNFISFIVVQQSSQPNFIAFPPMLFGMGPPGGLITMLTQRSLCAKQIDAQHRGRAQSP